MAREEGIGWLRTARTKHDRLLSSNHKYNGALVFHTAFAKGVNRERFANFLTKTSLNLDPDKDVLLIYDDARASNNHLSLLPIPSYENYLHIAPF